MKYLSLWLTTFLTLLTVGQVHAITVTDLNLTDQNSITRDEDGVGLPELPFPHLTVESYGERTLIPYPSHDGRGIVNPSLGYFDSTVNLDSDVGWWRIDFIVTNNTPYVWSDYHFEFWTANFENPLLNFPLRQVTLVDLPNGPCSNHIFLNDNCSRRSAAIGPVVAFWAPNSQSPGQTNTFELTMNLDEIRLLYGNVFGLRQVATTIPEPAILALMSIGLAGIVFVKHRNPCKA